MITQDYLHERFTYRDGELYWKVVFSNRLKVGQLAGDKDGRGYRRIMMGKKHFKMHRLIWIMFNGNIPDDIIVDHKDRNIDNNRIENLRLVTKSGNNRNRDVAGVTFDKTRNKWRAQASVADTTVFLGRFDSKEDAEAEYRNFTKFLGENGEVTSETS
jgi:hypothetical protein